MTALSSWRDAVGCRQHTERYQDDCLVRHLLEFGMPGALALGWDGEPLTITAGIGTLTITAAGLQFSPVARAAAAQPAQADAATQAARRAICEPCTRWSGTRCGIGGCGCAGLGKIERRFGKCPMGKW